MRHFIALALLLGLLPCVQICQAFISPSAPAVRNVATASYRSTSTATGLLPPILISEAFESTSIAIGGAQGLANEYIHGQYAFMLPTATLVATSCQLAGIGGAALFSPIFLLVFPFLGPQYPLETAGAALASALLTECFGFASGLSGYARRGLVDWDVAGKFLVASIPAALLGAVSAKDVSSSPELLQCMYATLMLGLAGYLLLAPRPEELALESENGECSIEGLEGRDVRETTAADGTEFSYLSRPRGSPSGIVATWVGGGLTGLLGVGIGEVILPQLVRGCCMPLPIAAGTSVAIVVTTALTAASVQFLALAAGVQGDGTLLEGLISVVPWSLVRYTIPGVLVGGQLAPLLASKGTFSDEAIERFAATLFAIIGTAFAVKAASGLIG